jgi:hypothetical protein
MNAGFIQKYASLVTSTPTNEQPCRIVSKLDALLPAILYKAFIRLHPIPARQEGKL